MEGLCGILEFNVPLDTVQVISETGALSSDVHLPLGALKMQDRKMQDLKMQDQIAGHENAGPENAGRNCRA